MLLDESLNLLESRDDSLLPGGPPAGRRGAASTPKSSNNSRSSSVTRSDIAGLLGLLRFACKNAMPSAIRFSQASAAVIDGNRPLSSLNRLARFDQLPRIVQRHADPSGCDNRSDLLEPGFGHRLGQDRIRFLKRVYPIDQIDVEFPYRQGITGARRR